MRAVRLHEIGGVPTVDEIATRCSRSHRTSWRTAYQELCRHVAAGRIHASVESFPLDRVAEAWERQASGSPRAKIVLTLS